jgi:ABC-type sugar transport system permease subunit/outer membrane protein assembly factor BamB
VFVALLLFLLLPKGIAAADGWTAHGNVIVYCVATSADGNLVVAGQRDNNIVAYDSSGKTLWTFATRGTVYDVAVAADGSRIAVASEDRNVYLLDASGKEIWRYSGPQTFLSVSMTADGTTVAAGSEDRTVSLLDANGGLAWQYQTSEDVAQVAIYGSVKGFRVVAGTRDSRVSLLGGDGKLLWEQTLNYGIRGLSATKNGATVAAGDDRGTLYLLDGGSGKIAWEHAIGQPVPAVSVLSNGAVVAGDESGKFWVFDADGKQLQQSTMDGKIHDLAIIADGSAAAIAIGNRVLVAPSGDNGQYQVPSEPSRIWRVLELVAVALVVLALIALPFALRRRTNGERAWRGYARRQRRFGREVWRARMSYLFLVPTLTLLLIFNYYPAFSGIYHAFTDWRPGVQTKWVGLKQFRVLADDRYFWKGIGNLIILIVTGFLKLAIPLAVAEMIFHLRSSRLRYAMRTLFVLQIIVPGVVGILLWVNVYDPNIGLANQLLRSAGLDQFTRSWLGEAHTAIWAIVFMGFPWVSAFALLIFYGGLISIPGELFDAAALDGASAWRRILNVDLPLLLGQIRLLVILVFIAMVQEFAAVFLTTGGGPGSSTYVPSLELYYQAVRFNNFGVASAIGATLFIVILAGTILNLRYVKSSVEYGT